MIIKWLRKISNFYLAGAKPRSVVALGKRRIIHGQTSTRMHVVYSEYTIITTNCVLGNGKGFREIVPCFVDKHENNNNSRPIGKGEIDIPIFSSSSSREISISYIEI